MTANFCSNIEEYTNSTFYDEIEKEVLKECICIYIKLVYILKGCLDDSDCSEYGTECNLDGINKHSCASKFMR